MLSSPSPPLPSHLQEGYTLCRAPGKPQRSPVVIEGPHVIRILFQKSVIVGYRFQEHSFLLIRRRDIEGQVLVVRAEGMEQRVPNMLWCM